MNKTNTTPIEKTVVCPGCGGPSLYAPRNVFRPFCSHRCQQGDLGRWASEEFRLAAPDSSENASQSS